MHKPKSKENDLFVEMQTFWLFTRPEKLELNLEAIIGIGHDLLFKSKYTS